LTANRCDSLSLRATQGSDPGTPIAAVRLLLADMNGDVRLAVDDRDRQLDRAAARALLLDASSGHGFAVAALLSDR